MKIKKILLAAVMLLIIGFIWSNSMEDSEKSYLKSNHASEIAVKILSPVFPEDSKIIHLVSDENHIRKIGHFAEYFILGVFTVALSFFFAKKNFWYFYMILSVPFVISVLDEFIQSFTGRTSLIRDVWIDCSGYLFGAFLVLFFIAVFKIIKSAKKKGKSSPSS